MTPLSTRSFCDECGRNAVVQIGVVFFCDICVPCEAGEASAADIPAPGRLPAADAPISNSCGGVEGRLAHTGLEASGAKTNPDRLDTGMVTPLAAPLLAGVATGPHDSIPNPASDSLVSETCGAPTTAASPFFSEVPEGPSLTDRQAADGFQQMSSAADPGMSGFNIDFEYEVACLESKWARDGICMKTTTFLVSVASDNSSRSVSVTE